MKPVIVYKAVEGRRPWYRSHYMKRGTKACKSYRIGKVTRADLGGLLCHLTAEAAQREGPDLTILRCEATERVELSPHKFCGSSDFWNMKAAWENTLPFHLQSDWPLGTVAYKEVKPLEVVTSETL